MVQQTTTGLVHSVAFTHGARCLLGRGRVAILLPVKQRIDDLDDEQLEVLHALNRGPAEVPEHPSSAVASLLDKLIRAGAISLTVSSDGHRVYTLQPFREPPGGRPESGPPTGVLSRFTVLRRVGHDLVGENPRSWTDVVFHEPAMIGDLTSDEPEQTTDSAALHDRLLADLDWAGHLTAPGVEEEVFETRSWTPHELWFHRRSTVGERGTKWADFGPTRWADGQFEPLPARHTVYPGDAIALPVPDLDALRVGDTPLTAVVEDRKSVRAFDDDHPISAAQLGELLYRCARTRSVRTINADRAVPEELPSRPFPSGGSLYELEIYPVVRIADGVGPGMYHYDSYDHVLRPVVPYDHEAVQKLIAPAALTLEEGQQPQVLLVLAARHGRISWTYEQMPYAVILKHVGVLTQNLYLAATAMGLGGVAQGYGDTAAFASATGLDELSECNVGSFVVGTRTGQTDRSV